MTIHNKSGARLGDNAPRTKETELRAGALKLPSVLMQGITHIAPAVGIVLTIQLITSLAGVTTPLA